MSPFTALLITTFLGTVSAASKADTRITVERMSDGEVAVSYALSEEVQELPFAVDSPAIRDAYWTLDESLFELEGDRITSERPFRRVVVTLQPNDRPIDRVYPLLTTLDETTSVVNLDYIRLRDSSGPVVIRNGYSSETGTCRRRLALPSAKGAALPDATGRYVLLSTTYDACAAHARGDGPGLIYPEGLPAALVELASAAWLPAYEALKGSFRVPPEHEPLIILSQHPQSPLREHQGDVGWESMITMRFYGAGWDSLNEGASRRLLTSVTHEIAHLWIGTLLSTETGEGPTRAWLHEGAAEYVALLELLRQGVLPREYVIAQLEQRTNACMANLDSSYLMTDAEPAGGRLVYDCGVLVQLVYDAAVRVASSGDRTILDVWGDFLETSVADGTRTIRAIQFVDSDADAKRLLAPAFYGPEFEVNDFAESLRGVGIEAVVQESASVERLVMQVLLPFYRADCEQGPFGFWTHGDHLALDANESCRTIPRGFVLRHIEGHDILDAPGDAYRAASSLCAAGESIKLSGRTGDEPRLNLRCPAPLPPFPLDLDLREPGFF